MKKKVILCPNPYRDSELKVAKDAKEIGRASCRERV